jgi:spermidine/putrescine transport system substrate-binding protein
MKSSVWGTCLKIALGCTLLAAAGGIACRPPRTVLHLYTWADYIKPELVARFETEHHCRVVIDTFDSNEAMHAKLQAGAGGYDLITPSSYMVKTLFDQGLLQPLRHELIPNLIQIDPEHLKISLDKTLHHSVPYMLTNTGIAYRKSKVADFQPTWAMFDAVSLKGRMTLLDDMRETIGAALKFSGFSLNSTNAQELAEARDIVIRWKKNLAKFENEQYKTGLASGEFLLVHGYSGDILQVQSENPDIAFAIPREGTSISCDDLVIPQSATQVELAHQFINFLHDPQVAKENTEFIQYLCPNTGAYRLLSPDIRENPSIFLDPAIRAKSEMIDDIGEALPLYTRMWDEIKAAE